MSKMSELDTLLTELSENSKAMLDVLRSIREQVVTEYVEEAPASKQITIEEVRAVLLAKRKAGFKEEVKALLNAHGAPRLTDIDPAEYRALMEEAEAIGT